jgi:hypothetical protein
MIVMTAWELLLAQKRFNNVNFTQRVHNNPVVERYNPVLYVDKRAGVISMSFNREPTEQEKTVLRLLLSDMIL